MPVGDVETIRAMAVLTKRTHAAGSGPEGTRVKAAAAPRDYGHRCPGEGEENALVALAVSELARLDLGCPFKTGVLEAADANTAGQRCPTDPVGGVCDSALAHSGTTLCVAPAFASPTGVPARSRSEPDQPGKTM